MIKPKRSIIILVMLLIVILGTIAFIVDKVYAGDTIGDEIRERGYDVVMADYPCFEHSWLDFYWICSECGDYVGPRYGFSDEEVYLLAQLVAGDKDKIGDGEYDFTWYIQNDKDFSYYEIGLALCVVMNRVRSIDWPDTVYDVVTQNGQFAVMPRNLNADPCPLVIQVIEDWCLAYDRYDPEAQVIPENHIFFNAARGYIGNVSRPNWRRN